MPTRLPVLALGLGLLLSAPIPSDAQRFPSGGPTAEIESIRVDGVLSRAGARSTIARRLGELRLCYMRARSFATFHVRVTIQVSGDGVPAYVAVTGVSGSLASCVEGAARAWVFAAHDAGASLSNVDARIMLFMATVPT